MEKILSSVYEKDAIYLKYYEICSDNPPLVLIHAQGVDSESFFKVMPKLAKKYHVYAVDCYGHGGSLHDASKYNVVDIGNAVIDFIQNEIENPVSLLGHSSGGLIAAYVASHNDLCRNLILEDPPFFASQGERRKSTFNFVDLSTVCHEFLTQTETSDFVLYYFSRQYAWNFFPEKSREKIREKMIGMAEKFRQKNPNENLRVPFWPKVALAGFQGMNRYDPRFGEAFYTDSFHAGIPHEELLRNIHCRTMFMKAKADVSSDGILLGALGEEDLHQVLEALPDCRLIRFDCGHGIHVEKSKEFIQQVEIFR